MEGYISKLALGRHVKLGNIYNLTREKIDSNKNVWYKDIPKDLIQNIDVESTKLRYLKENSLKEKFEELEIDKEFAISILFGLFEEKGHIQSIERHYSKSSIETVELNLNKQTKIEKVRLLDPTLLLYVNINTIEKEIKHHFVSGIEYGYRCTVNWERCQEITGSDGSNIGVSRTQSESLKCTIDADDGPSKLEISEINKHIEKLLKKTIPIKLTLVPVSRLVVLLQKQTEKNLSIPSISDQFYFKLCTDAERILKLGNHSLSVFKSEKDSLNKFRNQTTTNFTEKNLSESIDNLVQKICSPSPVSPFPEWGWGIVCTICKKRCHDCKSELDGCNRLKNPNSCEICFHQKDFHIKLDEH